MFDCGEFRVWNFEFHLWPHPRTWFWAFHTLKDVPMIGLYYDWVMFAGPIEVRRLRPGALKMIEEMQEALERLG